MKAVFVETRSFTKLVKEYFADGPSNSNSK